MKLNVTGNSNIARVDKKGSPTVGNVVINNQTGNEIHDFFIDDDFQETISKGARSRSQYPAAETGYRLAETVDRLKKLFAENKHSILQSTVEFSNLLSDCLPASEYRKEFNILHSVFSKPNIGSKLYEKHSASAYEQRLVGNQLVTMLVDEHGLSMDAAKFAINAVVTAMGWQPI